MYRVFIKYCVFPRCQCVYTHQAGRTPALQRNLQSSEKSQIFRKKTIFNEHPVPSLSTLYLLLCLGERILSLGLQKFAREIWD